MAPSVRVIATLVLSIIYLTTVPADREGIWAPSILYATIVSIRLLEQRHNLQLGSFWQSLYHHDFTHVREVLKRINSCLSHCSEAGAEAVSHQVITQFHTSSSNGRTDILTRPWEKLLAGYKDHNPAIPERRLQIPAPILFHRCCFEPDAQIATLADLLALELESRQHQNVRFGDSWIYVVSGEKKPPIHICCCGGHEDNDYMEACVWEALCEDDEAESEAHRLYWLQQLQDVCLLRCGELPQQSVDQLLDGEQLYVYGSTTSLAWHVAHVADTPEQRQLFRYLASAMTHMGTYLRLFRSKKLTDADIGALMFLSGSSLQELRNLRRDTAGCAPEESTKRYLSTLAIELSSLVQRITEWKVARVKQDKRGVQSIQLLNRLIEKINGWLDMPADSFTASMEQLKSYPADCNETLRKLSGQLLDEIPPAPVRSRTARNSKASTTKQKESLTQNKRKRQVQTDSEDSSCSDHSVHVESDSDTFSCAEA